MWAPPRNAAEYRFAPLILNQKSWRTLAARLNSITRPSILRLREAINDQDVDAVRGRCDAGRFGARPTAVFSLVARKTV